MFRQYAVEISSWAYDSGWTYKRHCYDWLDEPCTAEEYIKSTDGDEFGWRREDGRDLLFTIIGYVGDPMFDEGKVLSECWLSKVN